MPGSCCAANERQLMTVRWISCGFAEWQQWVFFGHEDTNAIEHPCSVSLPFVTI